MTETVRGLDTSGDGAIQPSSRRLSWILLALSTVVGTLVAIAASGAHPILALLFPAVLLPVFLWRDPRIGLYLAFGAAVVFEQFEYAVGQHNGAITASIPVFRGDSTGGITPVDMLLGLTALIVAMQLIQRRESPFRNSRLAPWAAAVVGVVTLYLVLGIARGGDPRMALWEVRPYFFLAITLLLATILIRTFSDLRPVLWIIVLGSGAKALYGLAIFASVRNDQPRPEAVLGHEESFLFGVFIITTLALWGFVERDRIRTVATVLLPFVLMGDLVNSRRLAWLILGAGLILMLMIAFARRPHLRLRLLALLVIGMVGLSVYLPLYWDRSGSIAQPARAVRSIVAPDPRDEASNEYRVIESNNLDAFIAQSHSLGRGFGLRLEYVGLVDLTEGNELLEYISHNTVKHIWLRVGIGGMAVFALFLGQSMVSATRLTADRRHGVAVAGAVVAPALLGYVAMGYFDLGFFWFRNAIVMGVLIGAVDGLGRGVHVTQAPCSASGTIEQGHSSEEAGKS